MKKYLLFSWETYFQKGGANDFVDAFDDVCSAKEYFMKYIWNDKNKWYLHGEIDAIESDYFVKITSFGTWRGERPHWEDEFES